MAELKYDEKGIIIVRESRRVLWSSLIVIILAPLALREIAINRMVLSLVLLAILVTIIKDLIRFFRWRVVSSPTEITVQNSLSRPRVLAYHELDQVEIKRNIRGQVSYHLYVEDKVAIKIPENYDGAKEFLMQLPKKQIPFYHKGTLVKNFDIRNF